MGSQQLLRLILTLGIWIGVLAGAWGAVWSLLPPGPPAVLLSAAAFVALYLALMLRLGDAYLRFTLLIPAMALLLLVTVVPIAFLTYLAFFRVTILNFRSHWPFVGLENFVTVFRNDPLFLPTLVRTLELLVLGLLFQFGLGLGMALWLNRRVRFESLLATLILLPMMTNSIVVGMLWKHLLNFYNGLLNLLLGLVGVEGFPWLTTTPIEFIAALPAIGPWLVEHLNANYAFLSILVTNTWQWMPFMFLLLRAALRSLPAEPFEAARIDGATAWQTFWFLTLPLLKGVIGVVLLVRAIDILKTFGMIWALFGNATVTRVMPIHIYTVGIQSQDYSQGAVLSLLLAMVSVAVYWTFQRSFGRPVLARD
ncbi:MAG: sugar ABC transporter permease [candidate division NC10 bacterium]|nr:sugar ABC transporter permease [candidate division NC10 bacterium]